MNSKDIRRSFLDFFKNKEHKIVPSASVVPYNDPTLLFTNAGMNQFKDVFLGTGTRDYSRAADTQKCIRAGGKHNDLEEVGHDGYHHTFFEMLGNWSFGDYYKKEAITWAWELLTDVWKLPKEKLWVTVFETDDEAYDIWKNETDILPQHILRFDEKDNFWEMGDTGPCGPCSEIHFDFSPNGCKPEDVNSGNENVIEIWNLVFIQYNRKKDRELEPLPMKHIDTGMGFERIVRVLQNKRSNYETDVFQPLITKITVITEKKYEGENISSINAIADHIRSLTFAISDGAIPSNEGRGYVLRRILRRASRLARKLDYHQPILFQLVDTVVEQCSEVFPELNEKNEFAKEVIKAEEESFNVTLDRGIKLFNEVAVSLKDTKIFPGDEAFKLYDTFGFPIDLTEVMAAERGLNVDMLKFEEDMGKQKLRGRDARKDKLSIDLGIKIFDEMNKMASEEIIYNPYDVNEYSEEKNIAAGKTEDGKFIAVINENPFYSESGGQISDTGKIIFEDSKQIDIIDSQKYFLILSGENNPLKNVLQENDFLPLRGRIVLDSERRRAIERNHTATHLVHESLRRILGSHVKQLGSLVHNEYLRFDFPHFHKVEDDQLKDIEDLVNSKISEKIDVVTDVDISIEEANKIPNVKKFFGEKYGDKVRVVHVDDNFSIEFCGGTHVKNTNDIGLFKIIKEESIASGTRRIFARTGEGILTYISERISDIETILNELPEKYTSVLRTGLNDFRNNFKGADYKDLDLMKTLLQYQDTSINSLHETRDKYLEEKKLLEKQLLKQNLTRVFEKLDEIISKPDKQNGFDIIASRMDLNNLEEFKEIGDELRKKVTNGVALIAVILNGKINLVCSVSDNLIKEKDLSAGKLISEAAKKLGGGGGGKPHLATAGGKDISQLDKVIDDFKNFKF
ncbi:MAG: alanine--tRNA ligase [Ignavibacteria bacterium]